VTDADERARARAILDMQEGRGPVPVLDDAGIEGLLRASRRIAVVGASPRPGRPSHDVLVALRRRGWDVVPVTPVADEVAGITAYPTLAAAIVATGPFDIVDVFRRAEACPEHARETVEAGRSRCLQLTVWASLLWEQRRRCRGENGELHAEPMEERRLLKSGVEEAGERLSLLSGCPWTTQGTEDRGDRRGLIPVFLSGSEIGRAHV